MQNTKNSLSEYLTLLNDIKRLHHDPDNFIKSLVNKVRKDVLSKLKYRGYKKITSTGKPLSQSSNKDLREFFCLIYGYYPEVPFMKTVLDEIKIDLKNGYDRRNSYVYFVGSTTNKVVKIGFSGDPINRLSDIQVGCPFDLEMLHLEKGGKEQETKRHEQFKHLSIRGEWFSLKDDLETFLKEKNTNLKLDELQTNKKPIHKVKPDKKYVVWKGRKNGIFDTWEECKKQIQGYKKARYKSFPNYETAHAAFHKNKKVENSNSNKSNVNTFRKNNGLTNIYLPPSSSNKNVKHYVVWKGRTVGIFSNWDKCKESITDFKGAKYKSFGNYDKAVDAYISKINTENNSISVLKSKISNKPKDGFAVDASCLGNPGVMEYQCKDIKNGKVILNKNNFQNSTNNIGEFLAIVDILRYSNSNKDFRDVYSDSMVAMSWVKKGKAKTSLKLTSNNQKTFDEITMAEKWLKENNIKNRILKWHTSEWGEIPADFGRK